MSKMEHEISSSFLEELEILRYYENGAVRNEKHSKQAIRYLKDCDLLRCGIDEKINETLKTTARGKRHLESNKKYLDCLTFEGNESTYLKKKSEFMDSYMKQRKDAPSAN